MEPNLILDTDSYKASHHLQFPPKTTWMYNYLESRGGLYKETVFFGLQYLLKEYFTKPVTMGMVDEAEAFFKAHGEPFPRSAWERVVKLGYLPLSIRAVPEGLVVPTHNVLMDVQSTDPETFHLVGWLETQIMRLWYPITVCTISWQAKKVILQHLIKSGEDPWGMINFKLHDFGARGVSSRESAGIGGMAHLVNFMGSDTVEGVRYANHYYNEAMSAFSIPAAEHSTITMWGKDKELDAYANMIKQFAKPGALVACVSDSYDLFKVVKDVWCGSLRDEVVKSGATLVIRPDSGNPAHIVCQILSLMKDSGIPFTKNSKGYLTLPSYYRIIQGDGVNPVSIDEILTAIEARGFSADNIAFGMGGALLQQCNRDTQKFAFKCSAAEVDGQMRDVFKDPVTDHGKRSKSGMLDLTFEADDLDKCELTTVPYNPDKYVSAMKTVFENGDMCDVDHKLSEVRELANLCLKEELEEKTNG